MFGINHSLKIYIAVEPIDLRKSFNGLYGFIHEELIEDPSSGAVFLFTNSRKNRVKTFHCDGTGIWVSVKRLDQGCFSWPKGITKDKKFELCPEALALIIDGVDLKKGSLKPWYQR